MWRSSALPTDCGEAASKVIGRPAMSFAPAVSFSRPWTRAADLAAGEGVDLSAERRRRGLWSRVAGGGMESRGCKAGSGIEGPRHGLAAAQSAANALVSGGGTEYREHTNEKRIQLYVFREEANIDVAPSDPQHEVDGPAIRLEDVFDEGAVKTKTTTSQRTVRRSKRLNVVQSHIEYIDGERDSVLETHDLEDNGNQVDIRDDRVDNISDGSSHDGGADAMEEIAKLKQLIEQQDKIIDALRNNDGFRGANEITMRVQANGPGEENTVIKPRDTVMKETHPDLEHEDCNEFSYQEPSSLANHVSDVQIESEGKDVMITAFSKMVGYALQVRHAIVGRHIEILSKEGISAEVINLRSIRPLDRAAINAFVRKTNRLVTLEEGFPSMVLVLRYACLL
ncbi:hypothetical protein ZWY2020_037490 [Hordeum vulgare]|nr:hypothetical protein ZWY2020_037490 [Hordeum vulgare]